MMAASLTYILSFVVAIGVLVTIHEFGHFWVARRCGVKVLRFSVGFGKPLYSWYDKQGTEYCIAAIPLGGYVKMVDEREGDVAEEDLPHAFNRKPVLSRIAIVAAGPMINLLFAVLVYWALLGFATTQVLVPKVGGVLPQSPAFTAQLPVNAEIVAVDTKEVISWEQIRYALLDRMGDSGEVLIQTASHGRYPLPIDNWMLGGEQIDPIKLLGIKPQLPRLPAQISKFSADSVGYQQGLRGGDIITQISGVDIGSWNEMAGEFQANPGKELLVTVLRSGKAEQLNITPAEIDGMGRVGIYAPALPKQVLREVNYSLFEAFPVALKKTWSLITLSFKSIVKMIQGQLSLDSLSGPITIAKVAGDSASQGFTSFVILLAYLSVMLGVINLLPIPALDGGHLLYFAIELIARRPLPERIQLMGLQIGMALLLVIMAVAMFNDIGRL